MAYGTPGLHTHQEWLGLVQPVGLVVAPVVLTRLGLFPESQPRTLADGQRRMRALFDTVVTREVPVDDLRRIDPELESLKNLNTPHDYQAALAELRRRQPV